MSAPTAGGALQRSSMKKSVVTYFNAAQTRNGTPDAILTIDPSPQLDANRASVKRSSAGVRAYRQNIGSQG
jgi:hypothetical protein